MPLPLWPHQERGVEEIRAALRSGTRMLVAVAPCGAGKTQMFSHIIGKVVGNGRKALILCHRSELIEQASRKLEEAGVPHGTVKAGHWRVRPFEPVQVASVQTLVNRPTLPEADVVMVDEVHHATSETWALVLRGYPNARIIGWTATPMRYDGRGLGQIGFERIVTVATIGELIDGGYLVAPRTFAPSTPDLAGVGRVAGEFNRKELGKAMDRPTLVGNVVDTWLRLGEGRTTIVFAVNVQHSKHLVERFVKAGVRAEHVDAATPPEIRSAILARLSSGETTVVSNVQLFTEGTDVPRASCGVFARPTLSESLWVQMAGRLLRKFPGKTHALLLDHAGNSCRLGLVTDTREVSLEGTNQSALEKKPPALRTCPRCFSVVPSASEVCSGVQWDGTDCGHKFERKARVILEKPGELRELRQAERREMGEERQAKVLAGLMRKAREAGHQPVAPLAAFRGMFGSWPSQGLRAAAERLLAAEVAA